MLLAIRNLPDNLNLNQIRRFIFEKCGLSDVILDGLRKEGDSKRIMVGFINESQAAIFMARINGIYVDGKRLIVENIREQKEQSQNSNERQYYETQMMEHPMQYQSNAITYATAPMTPYSYNNMPFYMAPSMGTYNYGSLSSSVATPSNVQYPGCEGQNFGPKPWEPIMQNQNYQSTIANSSTLPRSQSHSETNSSANYEQVYSRQETNTESAITSNRNCLPYDFNKSVGSKGKVRDTVGNTYQGGNNRWDLQNKWRGDIRKSPNRCRLERSPPRDRKFGPESDRDRDYKRSVVFKTEDDFSHDRKHNVDYNHDRTHDYNHDRNRDYNHDRYAQVPNVDRGHKRGHTRENYNTLSGNDNRDRNSKYHPGIKREIERLPYNCSEPTSFSHANESKHSTFNTGNYNNSNNVPEYGPKAKKRTRFDEISSFETNSSNQFGNTAYDPKKSNYYKALNLLMEKRNTTAHNKTNINNANIVVAPKKEPLPQNEKKWNKQMKGVLAKVTRRIIQEINAAVNMEILIKPVFFKLKLTTRARVREIIRKTKNPDITNIYKLYRDKFPVHDDIALLNAVKRDRRPLNQFQKDNSALKKAQKKLAGDLPATKKPSTAQQNKKAPKPMPAKVPSVAASARLPKYPMSDKQIHKQNKKEEKEAMKDGYQYPIEEKYRIAMEAEVKVLKELFISACVPGEDDHVKHVRDEIVNKPADNFAKVISMQLSRRLSTSHRPCVRIFYGRKAPSRPELDAFLKQFNVISLKKNDSKKFIVATCDSYDGYDKLIELHEWCLEGIKLIFKPLNIIGKVDKKQNKKSPDQNEMEQQVNDFIQDLKEVRESLENIAGDAPVVELEKDGETTNEVSECAITIEEEELSSIDIGLLQDGDLEDF